MSVSNKLSSLSKMWKMVQPIQPSFSNVPEGEYVAELKEMKLDESKKGRVQVTSTYEIADGEYEGKTVKRFDGLDTETNLGYFKGYCEIIGYDIPEDIELLQEGMDEFVANNPDLFNITIKIKDQYSNVYVNGVSEFVKGGEESEEEEATEEVEEAEAEEETTEEEVAEEEEEQEVTPPARKVMAKPVAKVAAKPVATVKKVVAAQPVKKLPTLRGR